MIWYADDQHPGTQCELRADNTSDVANLPTFAQQEKLKPGSTCLVIGESTVYMMDSQGNWKEL